MLHQIEQQMGHQVNHLSRGEVLPGLLIILFVEFADQLFKHIAHTQIGERWEFAPIRVRSLNGGEVDAVGGKLLQHIVEHIFRGHMLRLTAQIELVYDLFDVGTKTIQIEFEVCLKLLTVVGSGLNDSLEGEG